MANKLYEESDIQNIANSIRSKNYSSDTYKVSEMSEAIDSLVMTGLYVRPRTTWRTLFVDIDGTVLSEEYIPEGGTITFPTAPDRTAEGLTFLRWNQTDTIANHENYYDDNWYKTIVIGPEYELTDLTQPTKITVLVNHKLNLSYGIRLKPTVATGCTINWGDGTSTTTTSTSLTLYSHTYTSSDENRSIKMYYITIVADSGTYQFGGSSSSVFGLTDTFRHGILEIILGAGCTGTGNYMCYNCYSLKKLYMANCVTSIGTYAFNACYSLQLILLSQNLTILNLGNIFLSCYSLRSVILPHTIATISSGYQFSTCYGLHYISIPKETNITGYPFWCLYYPNAISSRIKKFEGVTAAWYSSITPETIYDDALPEVTASYVKSNPYVLKVRVQGGVSLGTGAFCNNRVLRSAYVPDDVYNFPNNMFVGCNNLLSIRLPEKSSVTNLGNDIFNGCWALRKLEIPENLKANSSSTLYSCYSLEEFNIPSSWTTIYGSTFRFCYGLRELTIPSTVTTFTNGTYTFANMYTLERIKIPSSVTAATGTYNFYQCYSLRYIRYSDTYSYIPNYTFLYDYSLLVIDFGNTRTSIVRFGTSNTSTTKGGTGYILNTSLVAIVVPDALYTDWVASTYWDTFKTYIVSYSDFYGVDTDTETSGKLTLCKLVETV